MNSLKVAVLFDEHNPSFGGSYSLIKSILDGFKTNTNNGNHEIVLISYGKNGEPTSNLFFIPQGRVHRQIRKILGKILPNYRAKLQTNSKLARFLALHEIDVVFFLGVSAEITNIPYIVTVWDLQHRTHPWFPEVGNEKAWYGREHYYSRYLPRAIKVITGTERGLEEIERFYGVDPRNISIIPHVINDTYDSQGITENDLLTEPYIYPAQFWAHKNHFLIVKAVAILRDHFQRRVEVNFLGGDKGNLGYIKQLVKNMGLENQIHFLGFVSHESKITLFSKSKGLIYPSFSGPENLPPLEAFMAGIPVLYSDFPGAREQLGNTPLYFNPHDAMSLARCILQLEDSPRSLIYAKIYEQKKYINNKTAGNYILSFMDMLDDIAPMIKAWDSKDFTKFYYNQ